jgi:pimeloyl-ACP methyl ester carboxylesterase
MPNETKTERITVHGIGLEVLRRGAGSPVLWLHGFQPARADARWLELLGRRVEVIAPSHPGFGGSPRPKDFESVYDLLHLYGALLETLPGKVSLIGSSFGGWLAAELALRAPGRVDKLVLVDSLGIKVSGRETPDILDVFNTHPTTVRQAMWHDPGKNGPDYDAMEDAELVSIHRNWESLSLYGWHPFMHHPRLAYWLPAIKAKTLVLWGESDGIVKPSYGAAMAKLIPGAQFAIIAAAGHHPEIEQPDAFADQVVGFLSR